MGFAIRRDLITSYQSLILLRSRLWRLPASKTAGTAYIKVGNVDIGEGDGRPKADRKHAATPKEGRRSLAPNFFPGALAF